MRRRCIRRQSASGRRATAGMRWKARWLSCKSASLSLGGDRLRVRSYRAERAARIRDTRHDRVSTSLDTNRSEEHTSELQSLMRISYAVFCLKKKNKKQT